MQNAPTIGDVALIRRWRGPGLAVRQVSRGTWIRAGILVFFCAFYVWTAASSVPIRFTSGADGVYGQIADAFLHGHTDLGDAPAVLEGKANPYDPATNGLSPWDPAHDLSLYHGKLYAYWGPAPVVFLFGPARLLGFAFSEALAVALFATLALVFSMLTLLVLQRRFVPQAPAWKVNAGIVLLGFANVLPYVLRSPDRYEVAISAALCFTMLGTWLLLGALLRENGERPSLRRLALGSLALGLAVASRPSQVIAAAGMIALCAWLLRRTPRGDRRPIAAALLGPLACCGVLLATYNFVRFHSVTEFGLSYQLAGVDVTARDAFSLSYLPPGLWYYLVAPPRLLVVFPFVRLPPPPFYPGHVPAVYDGVEPTGGIFVLAPLLLILLAVPFQRRLGAEFRAVLLTFALIAAGLVVLAAVAFWGATMRYEVDFASFLLIAALLVWLRAGRRWAVIAGVAAIAWASVAGLALSFTGQDDRLRESHPALWSALARDFSPVSRAAAWVTAGGPTLGDVRGRVVEQGARARNYATFDDQGVDLTMLAFEDAELSIVMPSSGAVRLKATAERAPGIPAGAKLSLLIVLPDGQFGTEPLGGPRHELDIPFRLARGVQKVNLRVAITVQSFPYIVTTLRNLRVERP